MQVDSWWIWNLQRRIGRVRYWILIDSSHTSDDTCFTRLKLHGVGWSFDTPRTSCQLKSQGVFFTWSQDITWPVINFGNIIASVFRLQSLCAWKVFELFWLFNVTDLYLFKRKKNVTDFMWNFLLKCSTSNLVLNIRWWLAWCLGFLRAHLIGLRSLLVYPFFEEMEKTSK